MPTFTYIAKDRSGGKTQGVLEAASPTQVVSILHSHALVPIKIKEQVLGGSGSYFFGVLSRIRKVKLADLVTFTLQLSAMVSAGVPLVEALKVLKDQTRSSQIRLAMVTVIKDVEGGLNLGDALAKHPGVFSEIYVSLVRSGEAGGVLDKILDRLAESLGKQNEFNQKVKGALIYPAIIIILLIAVMIVMVFFVIPRLTTIYGEIGATLPLPTQILIKISELGKKFWFLFPVSFLGFLIFSRFSRSNVILKAAIDRLTLKIPIWGKIQKSVILTNFNQTLSLLVSGGIPILDALRVVRGVAGNQAFVSAIDETYKKVEKGMPISQSISQSVVFPPLVSEMIKVGEETGKLDEVLEKLAAFFEQEADQLVRNLTTAIEPIIIIVIGVGVALMILSVILPIFKLATSL